LIVSLDDAPDTVAVDGSADVMAGFGAPYLIGVERHRDQYPASAGVLRGAREPHPNMIAPTALLTTGTTNCRPSGRFDRGNVHYDVRD
jgi:hypothetical protein